MYWFLLLPFLGVARLGELRGPGQPGRKHTRLTRCRPPQVQLERIRQAGSLERIRAILNDTKLTDINQLPET